MTNFVDKFYQMDPTTEDLLFEGRSLKNGMIVLIGDSGWREDVSGELDHQSLELARANNRWALVTNLHVRPSKISFVGLYDDGTKIRRDFQNDYPWLVKISTIVKEPHEVEEEVSYPQVELPLDVEYLQKKEPTTEL